MNSNRKKIGLALGSGSARGWAHIGVIDALLQEKIPIDYIAGTSIGAFVGAFYAVGEFEYLKEFAQALDWKEVISFFDVRFPSKGFLDGSRINELISKQMQDKNIEDALIPFITIATNLETGKEVLFTEGNIVEAVRASISIPGVFTPVKQNGHYLVDGGLVNPLPVDIVKNMGADIVIAVDLNHDLISKKKERRKIVKSKTDEITAESNFEGIVAIQKIKQRYRQIESSITQKLNGWKTENNAPNIFEVIANSMNIMETKIAEKNLQICPPNILLKPRVGHLGLFDFDMANEAIEKGREELLNNIDNIKSLLL